MSQKRYVIPFEQLRMTEVESVGGKNASLGEMISQLAGAGVRIPGGFATTAEAYREFLAGGGLATRIEQTLSKLDIENVTALADAGGKIRQWILQAPLPPALEADIASAYDVLVKGQGSEATFAVRSSATTEDASDASFAGLQDTFLWVRDGARVLERVRDCWASLYSVESISYRRDRGIEENEVAMAVVVQSMVDARTAGVHGYGRSRNRSAG